jgi:hypothetical protein
MARYNREKEIREEKARVFRRMKERQLLIKKLERKKAEKRMQIRERLKKWKGK